MTARIPILLAALASAGLAPAPVRAFVGGSANAGAPVTERPDPASAAVLSDVAPGVRACFDTPVLQVDAGRYGLTDYDSRRVVSAAAAAVTAGDARCVTVTFPPGTDVPKNSLLAFGAGAAIDGSGRPSVPGTAPLDGSTLAARAGSTQAPDLLGADRDAAGASITYRFDENLDPALVAGAEPTDFGVADARGSTALGQEIVRVDGSAVTVAFGQGVTSAVRFFTAAGAVRDRLCAPGPATCGSVADDTPSPEGAVGGAVDGSPALLSAVRDSSGRALATSWSVAVTPGTATDAVHVYREDGTPVSGTYTVSKLDGSPMGLGIVLPATAGLDPASVVLAGVAPGVAAGTAPNLYGGAPLGTGGQAPGLTDGPDLLRATADAGHVTFVFDEELGTPVDAAGLQLLTGDGSVKTAAAPTVSADRRSVTVAFGDGTATAAGALVQAGAVVDATGENAGPPGSAAVAAPAAAPTAAPEPSAAPTAVATAAPTATAVPVAGAHAKARRRVVVPGALRELTRRDRNVSGRIQASPPCAAHRRVTLTRAGHRLGRARTSRGGGFAAVASKSVAARMKVTVRRRLLKRRKVTIVCRKIVARV